MSEIPVEFLPTSIFKTRKAPVLWIGAGIPKRYVNGFSTWEQILKEASSKAGINEDQFIALKNIVVNNSSPEADDEEIFSNIALELSDMINDKILKGELNPKELFDENLLKQYRHNVDPLKLLVCSSLSEIEFNNDFLDELESLRKLSDIIPAIVTTNYDQTLESIFDKYKVYSNVDEYYFSDSVGLGEIYKIHGTVKRPSSIVLNANDYECFNKNSFIISSKIVSLLCESPMVIIGYSMGDKMIRNMLGKMFSSFSIEKRDQITKNILYIAYKANSEPKLGSLQLESDTGSFSITTLTVDSFAPIFNDLLTCHYSIPISQMRKIRQMIVRVISEDPARGKRIAYIGIEGIDDVDPERTVIAFTTASALKDCKTSTSYQITDLIKDVLGDMIIPCKSIVDVWFEGTKYDKSTFIPIFHYLRKTGYGNDQYTPKMKNYILVKKEQYQAVFSKKESSILSGIQDYDSFVDVIIGNTTHLNKEIAIMHAYYRDIIDEKEAKKQLQSILETYGESALKSTPFRRAVTFLAFKEYM